MDEDNNPIIKNTGDINIDTTTYFQEQTQNITQNGDYIYEQNENGAWHLELKPQDSTEPTDVNINISSPPVEFEQSNITNNGYYLMNKNSTTNKYEPVLSTPSNYDLNINITPTQSKINIKSFAYTPNSIISINSINASTTNVTVPPNNSLVYFYDFSNDKYKIYFYINRSSSNVTRYLNGYSRYYIGSGSSNSLYLYDDNNNEIMEFLMNQSVSSILESYFNKNHYNLILD